MKIRFGIRDRGHDGLWYFSFPRRSDVFNVMKTERLHGQLQALENDVEIYRLSLNGKIQTLPEREFLFSNLLDFLCGLPDADDPLPFYAQVWKGFRAGKVEILEWDAAFKYGGDRACCKIGNNVFRFSDYDTLEEIYSDHGLFWIIYKITECLENPKEHGLSKKEAAAYIELLKNM